MQAPKSYFLGQELNWDAPWVDVDLWVELPFWLMVDNTAISIEVEGHTFPVSVHGETFELHGRWVTDSKKSAAYRGPYKGITELSENIQKVLWEQPDISVLWRKCKTCLKIATRCNGDVWNKALGSDESAQRAVSLYLEELCRAHMPVVNRLIKGYRLATYDFFAFEVAPWDIPCWHIERAGASKRCTLVPYRGWDHPPVEIRTPGGQPESHRLIEGEQLRDHFTTEATPGELELLDALNLIERGDYSGAVRRVRTAIEVVSKVVFVQSFTPADGKEAAEKFVEKKGFNKCLEKYQALSGRKLPDAYNEALEEIRALRDKIVHDGYRITSAEQGRASKAVDTGRWVFNWFEDDEKRRAVREKNMGRRSFGRDLSYGVFSGRITPTGVILTPPVNPSVGGNV